MKGILMSFYRFITYLLNDLLKFIHTIALKIALNSFSNCHIHMTDSFKMHECTCHFTGINTGSFCYSKKAFHYKIFILQSHKFCMATLFLCVMAGIVLIFVEIQGYSQV